MQQPIINTWKGDDCFMDLSNHEISNRFPDYPFKALMGWDGIVIWDPKIDPVDMLDAYTKKIAAESCGQCTPCRLGTARLADLTTAICEGRGSEDNLAQIRFLSVQISRTARCDIGRTIAKPILELMDQYKDDFQAVIQGKRTVQRGEYKSTITAPCISACPSHVDIPAYLENVSMDRWPKAMAIVKQGCPMPGTIGRVCVRPCETHCKRGRLDTPLSIRAVKRFLADREMFDGMETIECRSPRHAEKVAIVGAGPAGLSCAYYLGQKGYDTTIFESQEGPGGMAAYGIPSYRLPRDVIAHEVLMVEKMGAKIKYGVTVGKDMDMDELVSRGYQAVFLGVGAPQSSKMRCKGEDAGYKSFMTGVDFLAESARGRTPLKGDKLVVIGGGNVAMDCVRTARRLGFSDVHLLYRRTEAEMPADKQEIKEAQEEGVVFQHLVAPVEVMAENEIVTGLRCLKMELGEPDDSGRRRPIPIPGSEFIIDCDAIIPAIGQVSLVDNVIPEEKDLISAWKTLVVDQTTFQSDRKSIFGGGDCVTGPDTLIGALAAGKNAARFIAQYLEKGECAPDVADLLEAMATSDTLFDTEEGFSYPGYSDRMEADILDPDHRIENFDEVEKEFSAAQARQEASRCLRCYRILVTAV